MKNCPEENNLGVLADNWLNPGIKQPNGILAWISNSMPSRSRAVTIPWYWALMRSHLEYYAQFWVPKLRKDMEQVHSRTMELRNGLES